MATYYFKVKDYIKHCNLPYGLPDNGIRWRVANEALFNRALRKDRWALYRALSRPCQSYNDSYIKISYLKPDKDKELISIGKTPEEYKNIKASLRPKPVKKYQRIDFFAQTNALTCKDASTAPHNVA